MNRRLCKRRTRNLMIVVFMIAAFCSGLFGRTRLNARAEEKTQQQLNCYYTSIQIKKGDNLWDIAEQYCVGSNYSKKEYVEELKRMNGLCSEQIHSGEYLTIVYFSE